MKPKGGGAMPPELEKRIVADFGSVENLKKILFKQVLPSLVRAGLVSHS